MLIYLTYVVVRVSQTLVLVRGCYNTLLFIPATLKAYKDKGIYMMPCSHLACKIFIHTMYMMPFMILTTLISDMPLIILRIN